jgi:integral membrane protein (TIGR01906 family)
MIGESDAGGLAGWQRWVRVAARVLFAIAIPALIISTAVRILFSTQAVYTYAIDHYHAAAVTGIARDDLIAATEDIRAYFTDNQDYLRTLVHDQSGDVVPLFNTREVLHMHDVKQVVRFFYGLQTWSLLVVAAYSVAVVLWAGEESLAMLARRALRAVLATLVLLVLFGVVAAAGGFDAAFVTFHQLVFHNDYWRLDPTRDHLVQMFPEGFWLDATVLLCLLIAAEALLLGGGAWLYLRRHRHEHAGTPPATPRSSPTDEERQLLRSG